MTTNSKSFWLTLSLVNLSIVAFLGFTLRSKILFPLRFIDFRSVESAHSHFAFAGWAGLSLFTLMIFDILPVQFSQRKLYRGVLATVEVSALGMAFLFPFMGYNGITIFFSSLYVVAALVFVPVFIRDLLRVETDKNIRLLSVSALLSLIISFLGTLGLTYIIVTKSGGSLLYRDSIYTFLHFQYNGFFTLAIFALFFNFMRKKGIGANRYMRGFSVFLSLSIIPTVFLSLLWHNFTFFYLLAVLGCLFLLAAVFYFFRFLRHFSRRAVFSSGLSGAFCLFFLISFALKAILQIGTIFPSLSDEIYGDRPVIIGFLHLVFLGFLTFFLLALMTEEGYFTRNNKIVSLPLVIFSVGIFANEFLLMLQGLGILFKTNSHIFKWLLWGAAIILFTGALSIACSRLYIVMKNKQKKPSLDGFVE
jgi:hypothetical protein